MIFFKLDDGRVRQLIQQTSDGGGRSSDSNVICHVDESGSRGTIDALAIRKGQVRCRWA